jgi:hypothetical protein
MNAESPSPSNTRGLLSPPASLQSPPDRNSRPSILMSLESQRKEHLTNGQCRCLQTYAEILCSMRQVDAGRQRLSTLLHVTEKAYPALKGSLKCSQCLHDSQVMQLCSMALKSLVSIIGRACSPDLRDDIRIGDHVLQQKDSTWICLLLLARNISTFKLIVGVFKRRLDRCRITGTCDRQEEEYMDQGVHSIEKSIDSISNYVRVVLNQDE